MPEQEQEMVKRQQPSAQTCDHRLAYEDILGIVRCLHCRSPNVLVGEYASVQLLAKMPK